MSEVSEPGAPYPHSPSLKVARPAEGLLSLSLNRPDRKNALSQELVVALGDALTTAQSDSSVRVIVLSGEGNAFCSGADLTTIQGATPEAIPDRIEEFHRMIVGIVGGPKPVIAVVTGPAVGFGADLCLACDVRLFATTAYLEESFAKIGLMPDGGGTHFLPHYVGPRAFEYLALGTRHDADRCLALGIANHVLPPAELPRFALEFATKLASAAPLAVAAIKQSLAHGQQEALESALTREKKGQARLLLSADFTEGVQAFLEKRAPRFRGK